MVVAGLHRPDGHVTIDPKINIILSRPEIASYKCANEIAFTVFHTLLALRGSWFVVRHNDNPAEHPARRILPYLDIIITTTNYHTYLP